MKIQEITKICKALGDEKRLQIVERLTKGELCACELLENLQITQPTLSHHMKKLADCNLIKIRKEGRSMYYSLNCQTLSAYRSYIGGLVCEEKEACQCGN